MTMSLGRSSRDLARQGLQSLSLQPTHLRAVGCSPSCSNRGASTSQRTMSSSAITQTITRRDSAKTRQIRREEEDAKLRKAIELYHVAGNFFPSQVTPGTSASGSATRKNKKTQRFSANDEVASSMDDVLDAVIKDAIKPADSIYGHYDRIQQKTLKMKTAQAVYDAEQSNKSQNTDWDVQKLHSGLDSDVRMRDEARLYTEFVPALDSSQSQRAADLPDVNDAEAVKAYIARVAREQASDEAMSNRAIDESLDTRSARVRDALFGTVNGSNPGLEVVRERARMPSVQEMAEKLRSEQVSKTNSQAPRSRGDKRVQAAAEQGQSEGKEAARQGQGEEQNAVGQTI